MDEIEWETKASVWLQALVYRVAHLDTPSLGMLFCTETMGHSSFFLLAYCLAMESHVTQARLEFAM